MGTRILKILGKIDFQDKYRKEWIVTAHKCGDLETFELDSKIEEIDNILRERKDKQKVFRDEVHIETKGNFVEIQKKQESH